MTERARLDSWKAIADYLGRDVRTVIRWEKERNLPVHRVPGGRTRTVYAFTDELQQWMARGEPDAAPESSAAATPARSGRAVAIATVLLVAGMAVVGVWAASRARKPVSRVTLEGSDLVARSADGRALWRHAVPGHAVSFNAQRFAHVGDLDDRPGDEVVVVVERVTERGAYSGSLYSFTGGGRLRWQVDPHGRYTFGAGEFGGPWLPLDVTVIGAGSSARIAVAVHHQTWWPSAITFYDSGGAPRGLFVNAGWLGSITTSPDRSHVVAAGVSNSRSAGVLAVLDTNNPSGQSPEDEGSAFACTDCPAGSPLKYFVMPFAEVRRAEGPNAPLPSVRAIQGGGYEVRVAQGHGTDRTDEMIYEFDANYALVRQQPSDSYWIQHARLEREGKINHTRAQCPEPQGPPARVWEGGVWRTVILTPKNTQ